MLGGSTGLNYLGWDRASKIEYDVWSKFIEEEENGEKWDYEGLLPYFKRTEDMVGEKHDPVTGTTASKEEIKRSEEESIKGNGYGGPIEVSPLVYAED